MPARQITPFQFLGEKPGQGGQTRNPDHIVTTFDVSKEKVETLHPAAGESGDLAGTANVGNVPAADDDDQPKLPPDDTPTQKAPKGAPQPEK